MSPKDRHIAALVVLNFHPKTSQFGFFLKQIAALVRLQWKMPSRRFGQCDIWLPVGNSTVDDSECETVARGQRDGQNVGQSSHDGQKTSPTIELK
jgi:hypothetical protein